MTRHFFFPHTDTAAKSKNDMHGGMSPLASAPTNAWGRASAHVHFGHGATCSSPGTPSSSSARWCDEPPHALNRKAELELGAPGSDLHSYASPRCRSRPGVTR